MGLAAKDGTRRLGFVARLVIATTLPHSEPAAPEFTRTNGLYDLRLLAPRQVGLPYGRYPRLALAWMSTEAVRRKTPLLPLAPTFSRFASQIGITPSTGGKGTLARLRDQLLRLVHLTVGGVQLIERSRLWWDQPASGDPEPFLLLSPDFYAEILAHPVPVDLDVVRALRSPLEMDVYMWLTYRSVRACRIGRPETIPWEALQRQFGAGYSKVRAFRFHLLQAIRNILPIYPEVRLRKTPAGLVLLPYPPHIPRASC